MSKEKDRLASARCVVVKIGSKSLNEGAFGALGRAALELVGQKKRVVIVSSGAISHGLAKLGWRARPKDMARLQAAAAAGQSVLMQHYEAVFGALGLKVAQVLLTHADLADRTRANNARNALAALLDEGVVPIINENDAVAVEEIRFGDNDQLASMVVPLVDAELLVLLSDVEGLLDERGQRVRVVRDVARDAAHLAGASTSGAGTGGMRSKVEAARRATLAGADVVIAAAREANVVARVLAGEDIGTFFPARLPRLSARHHWIAFTLRTRGAILLDEGASRAIRSGKRSVLAVGVAGVRGTFQPGDAIQILDPAGAELGRGLVRVSVNDAARLAGHRSEDGSDDLVVVHKSDLVVLVADA